MRLVVLISILTFSSLLTHAQQADSSAVKDSLKVYRDIERIARKRPYTFLLYKALFNLPKAEVKKVQKTKVPNYDKYTGRIIRNVYINTLDPFGYSIRDTARRPRSILEKGGNWLHVKSFPLTIKNQLLFKRGDPYDPLVVKESERILRSSTYVNDVSIIPVAIKGNKDSIDIYVSEQDVWSIEAGASWSPSSWTVNLGENNFMGTSHQIKERIQKKSDDTYIHQGSYTIPYVRNTFITATGFYYHNPIVEEHGVTFNRTFYSPLTKWMGGLTLSQTNQFDTLKAIPDLIFPQRIRYGIYDFWGGYSIPVVKKGESEEERGSNFILTGRNLNVRYMLKPPEIPDTIWNFQNTQFYLLGLGLSNRTYYRDYYIYRFGVPEDIPAGRLINVVIGQELTSSSLRWYLGLQGGFGKYIPHFGYLSVHANYGTFIRYKHIEQAVLNWELGYFTDLLTLGNWRVRQFVRLRSTTGYNRKAGETLYLTGDQGLRGFNSYDVSGRERLVINFQTQAYAPFSVIGFHFAPIIFFGFAWLGNSNYEPLLSSTMYQTYGVGLLVKNEYLVFKTFQFTMALYPYIPGRTDAVFKFNPVRTYNFTFRDFAIDKPTVSPYE